MSDEPQKRSLLGRLFAKGSAKPAVPEPDAPIDAEAALLPAEDATPDAPEAMAEPAPKTSWCFAM